MTHSKTIEQKIEERIECVLYTYDRLFHRNMERIAASRGKIDIETFSPTMFKAATDIVMSLDREWEFSNLSFAYRERRRRGALVDQYPEVRSLKRSQRIRRAAK